MSYAPVAPFSLKPGSQSRDFCVVLSHFFLSTNHKEKQRTEAEMNIVEQKGGKTRGLLGAKGTLVYPKTVGRDARPARLYRFNFSLT